MRICRGGILDNRLLGQFRGKPLPPPVNHWKGDFVVGRGCKHTRHSTQCTSHPSLVLKKPTATWRVSLLRCFTVFLTPIYPHSSFLPTPCCTSAGDFSSVSNFFVKIFPFNFTFVNIFFLHNFRKKNSVSQFLRAKFVSNAKIFIKKLFLNRNNNKKKR